MEHTEQMQVATLQRLKALTPEDRQALGQVSAQVAHVLMKLMPEADFVFKQLPAVKEQYAGETQALKGRLQQMAGQPQEAGALGALGGGR
jgi:hypothetical protein